MKTAVIVQARMGSKRLPGKVLMPLGGKPAIDHVISACDKITNADLVVCAIPDTAENDILADHLELRHVMVVRGHETDVLRRYYTTAREIEADIIVRITADCPALNPTVCERVITLLGESKADYASNVHPVRNYPDGWDCEAFTYNALERAHRAAATPYDREHVTPYMQRNFKTANLPRDRLTLDTEEDYERLQRHFAK